MVDTKHDSEPKPSRLLAEAMMPVDAAVAEKEQIRQLVKMADEEDAARWAEYAREEEQRRKEKAMKKLKTNPHRVVIPHLPVSAKAEDLEEFFQSHKYHV